MNGSKLFGRAWSLVSTAVVAGALGGRFVGYSQASENSKSKRFVGLVQSPAEHRAVKAALVGVVGLMALTGCVSNATPTPKPEVTNSAEPSPEASAPDPIEALNLPVSLEELRELSPEEMKALTGISVESVQNSDGTIDWEKVVDRTYENYNLQVNAGNTAGEQNFITNQSLDFETYFVDTYGIPLESGYTSVELQGLRSTHLNTATAAKLQNVRTGQVNVRTVFTNEGTEVVSESESGAVVRVNERFTDNFFSSGAFKSSDVDIISNLGRDTDANASSVQQVSYSIIDGRIVLSDTAKLG